MIHSKNLTHSFYSLMFASSLKETNGNQRKAQKQAHRLFNIEQEYSYDEFLAEYQQTKQPSQRPYWIMLLHLANR